MDIDKEVKAAQKRLATFINKIVAKANAQTTKDFAESRKKLNIK